MRRTLLCCVVAFLLLGCEDGGAMGGGGGGRGGRTGDAGVVTDAGDPLPPPVLSGVSASEGPWGQQIVLTGENLRVPSVVHLAGGPDRGVPLQLTDAGTLTFRYPFPAAGAMSFEMNGETFGTATYQPDLLAATLAPEGPFVARAFRGARPFRSDSIALWFLEAGKVGIAIKSSGGNLEERLLAAPLPIANVTFESTTSEGLFGAAIGERPEGGFEIFTANDSALTSTGLVLPDLRTDLLAAGVDSVGPYVWLFFDGGFNRYRAPLFGGGAWTRDRGPLDPPEGMGEVATVAAQGDALGVSWSEHFSECFFLVCEDGYRMKVAITDIIGNGYTVSTVARAGGKTPDLFRIRANPADQWLAEMCVEVPPRWIIVLVFPFYIPGHYTCARAWRDGEGNWRSLPGVAAAGLTETGAVTALEDELEISTGRWAPLPDGGVVEEERRYLLWPAENVVAAEASRDGVLHVAVTSEQGLLFPYGGCPAQPCGAGRRCVDGACECDPDQCEGCCLDGICRPGGEQKACGSPGEVCSDCREDSADTCGPDGCQCGDGPSCSPGSRCSAGTCVCDTFSCPDGCCAEGVCRVAEVAACGTDGEACGACDALSADNCGDGACRCGNNKACAAGRQCVAGVCECNSTSCPDGCCRGGFCEAGQATEACGSGGALCQDCGFRGEACGAGGCVCGSGPACGDGQRCSGGTCICDATSCPGGCCASGACQAPSLTQCGTGGEACLTCNPTRANACNASGDCACGNGPACPNGLTCQNGLCLL